MKASPQAKWKSQLTYNLKNLLPILYKSGEISEEQIRHVQSTAQIEGINSTDSAGFDLLLRMNLKRQNTNSNGPMILTEESLLRSVAHHFDMEYKRVDYLDLDLEVSTKTLPESFARKNMLVPLRVVDGIMELLVFNPFQPELWEDMKHVIHLPCRVFIGSRSEIKRLIEDFFQFRLAIKAAELEFSSDFTLGNLESRLDVGKRQDSLTQKHIITAVDYLFQTALRERASDIHIEPKRRDTAVRFRIDGILHTLYRLPISVHQAMISRIKTQCRLDIAEKRRAQDGRFQMVLEGKSTDVRVSTIPVAFGEKMVLRLLSSDTTLKSLDQLGMSEDQLSEYRRFMSKTHGLILVTGPTGSGKSTTLYSTLKQKADPKVNVVTVEDPIEMVVDDFNQIGIQPKLEITFASTLRHILRQDPDIIMVGEMRDKETADQAIQAALTGHLVFSTLHTNDCSSTLTRLLELKLEPFLLNATLVGIVAQRLVRNICPFCKTSYTVDAAYLKNLGLSQQNWETAEIFTLWKGTGCEQCRQTGYLGRSGIFEIVPFYDDLQEALRQGRETSEIRHEIRKRGIKGLLEDGFDKVIQGMTTVEEIMRVAM